MILGSHLNRSKMGLRAPSVLRGCGGEEAGRCKPYSA